MLAHASSSRPVQQKGKKQARISRDVRAAFLRWRWVNVEMHSSHRSFKKWHNGPCPRSFARKKHQGRQSTPPGTCLSLHLDGLCYAVVSTDAHAAPVLHCLLHCLCSSKPQVPGETSAHPATAPEAGLVASSGREPAKHGPRGRLKAAPRGSSAAGREGTARSVVHCKKMHAHEQPLFREPVSVPMVHVRGWCVAVLLPE